MGSWRLNRYIMRELASPFFLGLCILTAVLLLGRFVRLAEMVISKGVPPLEAVKLFLYLVPSFLSLCLPFAFLLAIILAYGRLSADGELVAMKATGFGMRELLGPVLLFALPVCLLTAVVSLHLQPLSYHAFRNQVFSIMGSRAHVGLQERIFIEEFDDIIIYANGLKDRSGQMRGVFIQDRRIEKQPSVILAERGRILSDPATRTLSLRLEDGAIHRTPQGLTSPTYQTIAFDRYDVNLEMGHQAESLESRSKKDKELSLRELKQRIDGAESPELRNRYRSALHKRYAHPLAPLVFALIGVPLGMTSNRSGKGGGFTLALLVFLAYYLCMSMAEALATGGQVPAILALWLPNLLLLALGVVLVYRAATEKPLPKIPPFRGFRHPGAGAPPVP